MKILIPAIPYDDGKSGVSVYLREIVTALEEAGHTLTLVVEEDAAPEFNRFKQIRIRKMPAVFSMLYTLFILPWRIRWKAFDLCILPAANRRALCRYPVFTIAVVHDLSQYHVPVKYDRFRMFYIKRILPCFVRKAQAVVAVSCSTKRDLIEFWRIPEERLQVVYNGFQPLPEPVAPVEKRKQILYVSRIEHPGKNHLNLLRAFELLPPELRRIYTLVMPGAAWSGAEEVFDYAKHSPCRDRFRFPGFVRKEELPELYAQSSMYIFPSLFEGFGLSLLEAMAAGLPCACSRTSSLGELGDGAAELFDPDSPHEIMQAMRHILSSPERQQALCAAGHARAAAFSWRKAADELVRIRQRKIAHIFGVSFFTGTMEEAMRQLDELVRSGENHHVAFVNAHCLNLAYWDNNYRTVLNRCSAVFADGIGVKIGAWWCGFSVEENVNGTDLFPRLARKPYRIYLLGGAPGVAQAAMANARAGHPAAEFVGCTDGFFRQKTPEELFAELRTLKPDIVLTAMGVPLQEEWIRRHLEEFPGCVVIGVGGLLDFVSGRILRAPEWMRKSGLEWCYRLSQEPARLFKRYIIGNPLFIWRILCNRNRRF